MGPVCLGRGVRTSGGAALLAYGERLPFDDGAFNVSVAVTVLEFVRDPAEVLAEMSRVTRSPGSIVVGALNPRSP